MAFRAWVLEEENNDCIAPDKETSAAKTPKSLEEFAWEIIVTVRDEIIRGGIWKYSEDVAAAEKEVTETYHEFIADRGSMDDLQAACERWKQAGSSKDKPGETFDQRSLFNVLT